MARNDIRNEMRGLKAILKKMGFFSFIQECCPNKK